MVDRVLTSEMGVVSHSCFGEQVDDEEPVEEEDPDSPPKAKNDDILSTFKHIYVPEVVRDSRMWFKRVPRLGSFMAVPLCYQSCLSDDALEAATTDYQDVVARKQELQKEIDIFEDEQVQKKDAAEAAGEPFEAEEREWPEIDFAPFIT
jgi:hypothetical protein